MTTKAAQLTDSRRQDSHQRRRRVAAAIERLAASGQQVTVSAVARAAGVHRSLIYRHPDLYAAVIAHARTPDTTSTDLPSASHQSLLVDIANLTDHVRRQDAHIRRLEQRLAEALGEQVWRLAGLDQPPEHDAMVKRNERLEQENTELRRQVIDRDDDLAAARAANRQLMTQNNHSPSTPSIDLRGGPSSTCTTPVAAIPLPDQRRLDPTDQ